MTGFKKLTPVLLVDAVEVGVAFWVDRFGFALGPSVPGPDGKLTFAIVSKGPVEIMYQTRASVLAEEPEAGRLTRANELAGHSVALYFEVDAIEPVETALAGAQITKPRHDTFYGTTEIYALEPGGNWVGFAAPKA